MRWLLRRLARLPFGPETQRAIEETVADTLIESHKASQSIARVSAIARGLTALTRVIALAFSSFIHGEDPMRFLGNDIRAAARRLRKSPGYALFSIATLAVAIGSTTAVYSVIEAAIYRQQPIPNLKQIVNIYQSDMRYGASGPMLHLSSHDFDDLAASQTVFSELALWTRFGGVMVANGASTPVMGERVSGSYFPMLGVNAALGRPLQPADDAPQAPPVMVISDALWRRAFGADPSVIGQSVRLAGVSREIVGVAPPWFRGSDMPNIAPTPLWVPMQSSVGFTSLGPSDGERDLRNLRAFSIKARLKNGVSLDSARAQVSAISQRIAVDDPERASRRYSFDKESTPGWYVLPMADLRMHESVHKLAGPLASMLLGAVTLVLLVGCSNLTNLTLARAARRRQEIGVRVALGASRLRLVREQLVESSLIAVGGWAVGLLLAKAIMKFFGTSIDMHAAVTLTFQLEPQFNWPVLTASIVATGLAVVAVGLGPAIRQSRGNVRDVIASDGVASVAPRWRARASLVAGQVAVSVLLLALSTMWLREMRANLQHDPGFDLDRLAVMQVGFADLDRDQSRIRQELDAVQQMTLRIDGVELVSVMTSLPIGAARNDQAAVSTVEDAGTSLSEVKGFARWMAVSGPVFETMGIKVIEGRGFDQRDHSDAAPVAILSENSAERIFPDGHVVGRQIAIRRSDLGGRGTPIIATVVGIAEATDTGRQYRGAAVYVPLVQQKETSVMVIARASGDPSKLVAPMRQAMRQVDPLVTILSADTGNAVAGPDVMALQVMGGIAASLGSFAFALAVIGLYGVLADVVQRRTREIGIRIALGAERGTILRMVITDGLRPVFIGGTLGLLGAFFISQLPIMPSRFLPPTSLVTLLIAVLPLLAVALVACVIPARRAARVDPNVALRNL